MERVVKLSIVLAVAVFLTWFAFAANREAARRRAHEVDFRRCRDGARIITLLDRHYDRTIVELDADCFGELVECELTCTVKHSGPGPFLHFSGGKEFFEEQPGAEISFPAGTQFRLRGNGRADVRIVKAD